MPGARAIRSATMARVPQRLWPRGRIAARLAIVYGSQTGNGKRIAERSVGQPKPPAWRGVFAARDYPLKDLAGERLLTVVISTHGDGDPPDDARGFVEHITASARRSSTASLTRYSPRDSSYPKFCETGRQVDERLAPSVRAACAARRLRR